MWRLALPLLVCSLVFSSGCPRRRANPIPPKAALPTPVHEVKLDPDVDPDPRLVFRYDPYMRFGLTVLKDAAGNPVNKKLTYDPDGGTNDCLVRIDNVDFEFGIPAGRWIKRDERTGRISKSVWEIRGIEIAQILEIVPSQQEIEIAPNVRKRILDTCLVRYELENTDSKDHSVGLRLMVDTLIGMNDGVPFAVPTMQGLVNTFKDFPNAHDVPDFVQALEVPDLRNPGTVGHMTLKVGADMDAPNRVSLTAWQPPINPKRNVRLLHWDVPVRPMQADSAVVLYWHADRILKPTEKRTLGFAYGLGRLAAGEGTGKLALTVNGAFFPGGDFTVTAYVQKPTPNETLTLELPAGVQLVAGKTTEPIPPPALDERRETSTLTWTVKAPERGKYQLKVRSSTGVSQTQIVSIQGE